MQNKTKTGKFLNAKRRKALLFQSQLNIGNEKFEKKGLLLS